MPMKRRKVQLALLPWISTFCFPAHAAVHLKSSREQDDDGLVFQLRQHAIIPQQATSRKYVLRMPDHMVTISRKAKSMNVDATFLDAFFEEDPWPIKTTQKSTKSPNSYASLPRTNPLLNSGLAALALASIVSSNHGVKALKELAVGVLSALALVWVPTLLVSGSWMEFLGGAAFLTHPTSRRFLLRKLIPKIFTTLKKLLLSELWRAVWAIVLAPLPRPLLVPSAHDILRIQWLPDYLKEGFVYFRDKVDSFVLSTFKGYVQKSVHGTVGIFYDSVSSTVMEVSLYEESVGDSNDLVEDLGEDDGDLSDDDSDGDASLEPQVVCDGDVCWLE